VPLSVILLPAPHHFTTARRLENYNLSLDLGFLGSDGNRVLLIEGESPHLLWLRDVSSSTPLAALVPLDDSVGLRVAGLLRFLRRLDSRPADPIPKAWAITARLRVRLPLMLRALDGHYARASYREIARVLYGSDAVARYPWKTSSVRGQTIRLVKDAIALMEGGYRKLLRGNR
jgi:hypothetical protein